MLQDTIAKIEARVRGAESVNDKHREEMLVLVSRLRNEIEFLSRTHRAQAERIATAAHVSADAAIHPQRDPETVRTAVTGLEGSVIDFEKTHPQLVTVVNRLAGMLSNMGI